MSVAPACAVVDSWVKTVDKESLLMARRLIREEGLVSHTALPFPLFACCSRFLALACSPGSRAVLCSWWVARRVPRWSLRSRLPRQVPDSCGWTVVNLGSNHIRVLVRGHTGDEGRPAPGGAARRLHAQLYDQVPQRRKPLIRVTLPAVGSCPFRLCLPQLLTAVCCLS